MSVNLINSQLDKNADRLKKTKEGLSNALEQSSKELDRLVGETAVPIEVYVSDLQNLSKIESLVIKSWIIQNKSFEGILNKIQKEFNITDEEMAKRHDEAMVELLNEYKTVPLNLKIFENDIFDGSKDDVPHVLTENAEIFTRIKSEVKKLKR